MLNFTQACIIAGVKGNATVTSPCFQDQQNAISLMMAAMVKNIQCKTGEASTTVTPTTLSPGRAPPRSSSATNLQLNFFTMLPVLLILWQFY